mmetsp:Transcript_44113/g.106319  ORF Transcript_44113/g.106319 Transcript_44113/m.106319 type:complete len:104 (+) Transcript_44113:1277-1588(+)
MGYAADSRLRRAPIADLDTNLIIVDSSRNAISTCRSQVEADVHTGRQTDGHSIFLPPSASLAQLESVLSIKMFLGHPWKASFTQIEIEAIFTFSNVTCDELRA